MGGGLLLKNIIQGTFGSIAKISNSIATGLTLSSLDK